MLEPTIDSCEFADTFRIHNPSQGRFMYIRKNYAARLDYIFASLDVVNCIKKADIGVAFVTDHAPVYLTVFNGRNPSGRNYWKFPNYLLQCNKYKDALRKQIPLVIAQNKNVLSHSTLWDFIIKNQIRQFTSKYGKRTHVRKTESKIWKEEYSNSLASYPT